MLGHVPGVIGDGAHQRQAGNEVGPSRSDPAGEIAAVGVPEQQHRSGAQVGDEVAEPGHHVVVPGQTVGRRATHPRQIRIDPAAPGDGADGLDRRLDLPVIDAGPVQRHERRARAALDVVDPDRVDPTFHPITVVRSAR